MSSDKEIKKGNGERNNQQTPIDSDKESKNKLWKLGKARVKIWGYEGPFIHFLLLVLVVVLLIGGILYYLSIKEILYHRFIPDGGRTVVSQENEEMKQRRAESDDEYNASESEQIALFDGKEVEEQPRETSDTFRDKESKNNLSKLWEKVWKFLGKDVKIWGYEGPFIYFFLLVIIAGGFIIFILHYLSIREILFRRFVPDGGKAVVPQENGEVKQGEAEVDDEHNASEPEQIISIESEQVALTDDEEAKKQSKKVGDTFRDCDGCPEMVVVPAGSFIMGSPDSEKGRYNNEGPQHLVTISKPFAVGKYEVTRGQFADFIVATKHDAGDGWLNLDFEQDDKHPVVNVSWNDAKAYVDWLSSHTGQQYRLLSEAEWEYTARAGTITRYHFGDTISQRQANYKQNKGGTVVVGSYPANGFGLYDMHGNVWEWVEDCWHKNYEGAPRDGSAWERDCDEDGRVLRGGSGRFEPVYLRSAYRVWVESGGRNGDNGFRVARAL